VRCVSKESATEIWRRKNNPKCQLSRRKLPLKSDYRHGERAQGVPPLCTPISAAIGHWDKSGERRSIAPDLRLLGSRLDSRAVPMGRIHDAVSASRRSALSRKALTRAIGRLSPHYLGCEPKGELRLNAPVLGPGQRIARFKASRMI